MSADDDLRRALALGPRPSLAAREAEEAAAAASIAQRWRRRRRNGWLIATLIIVVVGVGASFVLVRPQAPIGRGLVPAGPSPTGTDGTLGTDIAAARFDPSGARVAAIDATGRLGILETGRLRPLTPEGTVITSFAWISTESLLVQEGPGATGQLAVLDAVGSRPTRLLTLVPSPPAGASLVAVPGDAAVLSTRARSDDGLGPVVTRLWAIDLKTGTTHPIGEPGAIGAGPLALLGQLVAAPAASGSGAVVFDLGAGTSSALALPGELIGAIALPDPALVARDGAKLVAVTATGQRRTLATVEVPGRILAIDADGRRIVVASGDGPARLVDL